MFPFTDTDENAGTINTCPISRLKSKASSQSILHSDLGYTSTPSQKNDWTFDHNSSVNFSFLLYLIATPAQSQLVGT